VHEDHIRSARIRLWLAAIGGLTVLTLTLGCIVFPVAWLLGAVSNVLGTGYGFGWGLVAWAVWVSLAIALPVSLALFAWSLLHAEEQALTFVHAWPRPNGTARRPARLEPEVLERVEHTLEVLSIAAGVTAPKVAAIVDDAPNCMTVGRTSERAWLVVTTGLVDSLSKRELEAVLAYELGRIAELEVSLDTVVYALTARSFELWVAAFDDVDHTVLLLLPLALLAVPFLLASVALRGVALRNRARLADGLSVRYCRDPGALARALQIVLDDQTEVRRGDAANAHLWLEYPHSRGSRWFFRSHRILPRRIRRLEGLSGATGALGATEAERT
jgi:heat shock protein HtpX